MSKLLFSNLLYDGFLRFRLGVYVLVPLLFPILILNLFHNNRLETGTGRNTGSVSDDGIDYDWLPKEALNELSKLRLF